MIKQSDIKRLERSKGRYLKLVTQRYCNFIATKMVQELYVFNNTRYIHEHCIVKSIILLNLSIYIAVNS